MKRKAVLITGSLIAAVGFASLWQHSWRANSMDGAYSEAGGAFGMTTWESMNSKAIVQESESTYSSTEEARKHFQDLLKEPGTIIESSASQGSAGDERIVKVFGSFDTEGGAAKIMKRRANKIELIDAGSLTYALAFERAWLKLQF